MGRSLVTSLGLRAGSSTPSRVARRARLVRRPGFVGLCGDEGNQGGAEAGGEQGQDAVAQEQVVIDRRGDAIVALGGDVQLPVADVVEHAELLKGETKGRPQGQALDVEL